jgi:hypothetical protein
MRADPMKVCRFHADIQRQLAMETKRTSHLMVIVPSADCSDCEAEHEQYLSEHQAELRNERYFEEGI